MRSGYGEKTHFESIGQVFEFNNECEAVMAKRLASQASAKFFTQIQAEAVLGKWNNRIR
jgi:hypothetical protein